MPRILVVYGTTDGHTGKVAQVCAERLRFSGDTADVVNASENDPDPASYDAVIVAASVHASGYQREIVSWVRRHHAVLNGRPAVFLSVCLGVLQHDPAVDRELSRIVTAFFESTSWRPLETRMIAGALKYTQYNVLKRFVMRRIARKAGGDTDTSRDYEYTDWNDLRGFVDRFSDRLHEPAVSASVVVSGFSRT